MSPLDLSQLGQMTPFWPGTNLTSSHMVNGTQTCFGNVTLCLNRGVLCTLQLCDLTLGQFDYRPSLAANAFFAAFFGLCLLGHLGLGIKYRVWGFMVAASSGFLLEVIGYAFRVMLHQNPFSKNSFIAYLVCLTIAPAFLSAAIYLCLARIVVIYGEGMSRFHPRWYTIVFCTCDIISLILQAAGGALAATAKTKPNVQVGVDIMLSGLSFQVFSLAIFAAASADFALRCRKNPQSWNTSHAGLQESKLFKAFLIGLLVATLTIFIRSLYRCAELSNGFSGALANNQTAFIILEGVMIVIAGIAITCLHPGVCFKGYWANANFSLRVKHVKSVKDFSTPSIDESFNPGHGSSPDAQAEQYVAEKSRSVLSTR